jgi:membrane protease YdiL (CAAX protease family)
MRHMAGGEAAWRSSVSDDQRAVFPPPDGAGQQSAAAEPTPSAAAAGLAVPWSARQAVIGGAATLVPLIAVQVWASLSTPATPRITRALTPQQDWAAALVIVLAQLVVEGIFLLAPWYYVRKCLPREHRLAQGTRALAFRRFDLGQAATYFVLGLVAVFAFNAFYSVFGLRTNADALVQHVTQAPVSTLATLVMAVTVVPVCEEVFFRGYLFPGLAQAMPVWAAVIASALIFGAAHADAASFAPLAVIGAALAVLRWRTGSLWPGILFHAAINASVLIYAIQLLARH